MNIEIIAVSHSIPLWVKQGILHYQKQLSPSVKIQWLQIKPVKNDSAELVMQKEAQLMGKKIKSGSLIIALDKSGKSMSSKNFSQWIMQSFPRYKCVQFLIGGAWGLHPDCIKLSQMQWSLSQATLPHQLVKLFVIEQLYRAFQISYNHPYHK